MPTMHEPVSDPDAFSVVLDTKELGAMADSSRRVVLLSAPNLSCVYAIHRQR